MIKITPLIKGVITGMLMISANFLAIYTNNADKAAIQYLFYALYVGGIAWTLIDYYRSPNYKPTFGNIFKQGFQCFIIITLIAVIFTGIFYSLRPEIAEQQAVAYKADLLKQGNKTPAEIDKIVKDAKDRFVTTNISMAAFGSLITGAIFTAAGAGILLMRRKQ